MDKKKFRCSKPDCKDLTFGRLADLRRHYDQQHAHRGVQFFCNFDGCPRSYRPTGGRMRSFGTRKDKRDEHERNVHKKPPQDDREDYSSFSPDEGSA